MIFRAFGMAALCALALAAPAAAQEHDIPPGELLRPGMRIRYTAPGTGEREIGRVQWVRGDTASVVDRRDNARIFLLSRAERLEYSAGVDHTSGAFSGAVQAGGASAVVCGAFGYLLDHQNQESIFYPAFACGTVGAVIGFVTGGLIGNERWIPIHTRAPVAVAAPAPGGGMAVGVSLTTP